MDNGYENYWLKKGTILADKYRISDVISEGGFGIVYLGFDLVLKMDVAIKEYFPRRFAIREQDSNNIHVYKGKAGDNFQEGLKKFLNEARILAKFNDVDSIVTVRDFFYDNNTAYIVNEHVVGETVKDYVAVKGKMSPRKVLEIMQPILMALSAIHSEGLLHRDISPDNIILKEKRAILIDFGAARLFQEQEDKSMTVFFKRGYSAQEQYVKNGKQSARTDVYAVCATMYYMLTGIAPEESVQRGIKDMVVPLSKMKDIELSMWAKNAIMKGMSVSIAERYSSVESLCKDLYREKKRWSPVYVACVVVVLFGVLTTGVGLKIGMIQGTDMTQAEENNDLMERRAVDGAGEKLQRDRSIESATPQPTTKEIFYKIPKLIGMKQKKAIGKIEKTSPKRMKIIVKRSYSSKVKVSKVIRQGEKPGTLYQEGEIKKIIIWVSRGPKPKPVSTQATVTQAPAVQKNIPPKKQKKNSEQDGDFAGALPW